MYEYIHISVPGYVKGKVGKGQGLLGGQLGIPIRIHCIHMNVYTCIIN